MTSPRPPDKMTIAPWLGFGVLPMSDFFRKLELDPRLVGMLAALALIWIGFDILTGGSFLTPRNLWNLSATVLPALWGFENPLTWIVAVVLAVVVGGVIGAIQGATVAYLGVASFIVTLGGQLIWR
eukprot:gene29258-32829_t